MPEDAEHVDPEQGLGGSESVHMSYFGEVPWSKVPSNRKAGTTSNSFSKSEKERRDFDDGANALWSLYGREAKTYDEARIQSLAADMDGIPTFAGLFSAVLTSFLVQSIQNLQANPVERSAYYQQQSVAMLAQISQQISATPPPPYPTFRPSSSDIRVNMYWSIGLVCSLSAGILAILVRQWARSYMQAFQRYDHPLKKARFRQFFFEGTKGMRNLAEVVPRLIELSLFLFFLGFGDSMICTNKVVGVATVVSIGFCGSFYLYGASEHIWNPQSPYQTLISRPTFTLMQKFRRHFFGDRFRRNPGTHTSIEAYQEELVMEDTEERKKRDVRAIRWLVDKAAVNAEMEPFILAIPGTINTEWGREVWINVASEGRSDPYTLETRTDRPDVSRPVSFMHHSPRSLEGTTVDTISRCVRYLFETCKNHSYFESEDARRRRIRACVEAAASLVCCIDFQLDWFGDVGKLVSEIGHFEKVNLSPTTTSDPSFLVRWTCLSLVAIQQILRNSQLQVLAGYAVSGLAGFQSEYGQPDEAGQKSAQIIEGYLKTAWKCVEEIYQALEPVNQKRTRKQVEEILRRHERQISDLERIKAEADGMQDVDWRIALYQYRMDEATYRLTRQLPGVSFDEPHRTESFLLSDTFKTPATGSATVIPQFIFPAQQVQALTRVGLKLREILDGQVADGYEDTLESLKSVDQVPVFLRKPGGLIKRQLWRLQDLRDGGGLGYVIELFFLSLRQLLSIPSSHESNGAFYIGTFKAITSHWEESKASLGTQCILLNLVCDLIIRNRGIFSGFSYPESIASMFVDMVGNMLQGHTGPDKHIRDAVREIENVDSLDCMDSRLRLRARRALPRFPGATQLS
ncbi:hypothetical protein V8E53_005889 [Lactarius tabidus]